MESSNPTSGSSNSSPESKSAHIKRTLIALLIVVAGIGLFKFLDYYVTANHLAELPSGYITKESERFQVFYAPETEPQAERMLAAGEQFIETFSSRYGPLFGGLEPPSNRIRLTLFRNHDEFREFARESLQVDLANNGGYCDAANQEIVLVMSSIERDLGAMLDPSFRLQFPTNDEADVMAMRHELVHYLMERGGGDFGSRAAPWLSEGLAGIFEMPDPANGSPPPMALWTTVVLAVSADTPRLSQLVRATAMSFRGKSNLYVYAFSALLVRFLWLDDATTLWSYVRKMRDGDEPGWSNFQAHFAADDAMESRWRAMIQKLRLDARDIIRQAHPKKWTTQSLNQ